MVDREQRELERDWGRDPEVLERAIQARRRAGIPVPRRFLMARRQASVPKPDTYAVFYCEPNSSYDHPLRSEAGRVPPHWLWGVRIENRPSAASRATWRSLLADHAVPALELWESDDALLEALVGLPLRALRLSHRTSWGPAGWAAVLALSELELLDIGAREFRPSVETFAELARLPRLTSLSLEGELLYSTRLAALGEGLGLLPNLTHLSLKQVSVGGGQDLAGLRAMPYLEELELSGPFTDEDLAAAASCPALRRLDLYKVEGVSNAGLARLRGKRLVEVRVRDCPKVYAGGRAGCPLCGAQIPPPKREPKSQAHPGLPPTGGDYEWVEVTSSSSLTCPQCGAIYTNTSRTRYTL